MNELAGHGVTPVMVHVRDNRQSIHDRSKQDGFDDRSDHALPTRHRHMLDVLANRRPARLPVYEHIISPIIMEQILGVPLCRR